MTDEAKEDSVAADVSRTAELSAALVDAVRNGALGPMLAQYSIRLGGDRVTVDLGVAAEEETEAEGEPLVLPNTGDESPTDLIYRVTSGMLRAMQEALPREAGGKIHVRLSTACVGVTMARWLAYAMPQEASAEVVVQAAFDTLGPLMVEMVQSERERRAAEAAERAETH